MAATITQKSEAEASENIRRQRIERAKQWCAENYRSNPTMTEAAGSRRLSRYHFCRQFRTFAGVTFKAYVDGLRIAEAQRLLLAGKEINAVATQLGFAHQSHFTVRFKQFAGQTPGRWLKAELKKRAGETKAAA